MNVAPRPSAEVPPLYFLAALSGAIALDRWLPVTEVIPDPWHWLGLAPLVAGLAMAGLSAQRFSRAGTGVRPFTEVTVLVTDGFYRYTRNPMYLGMLLVLLGVDVLLGSATPFLLLPVFVFIIQTRFIHREEAVLEAQFGEEFRNFCARTRRWL